MPVVGPFWPLFHFLWYWGISKTTYDFVGELYMIVSSSLFGPWSFVDALFGWSIWPQSLQFLRWTAGSVIPVACTLWCLTLGFVAALVVAYCSSFGMLRAPWSISIAWGICRGPLALGHPLLAEPLYVSTGFSSEDYCDFQSGEFGLVGHMATVPVVDSLPDIEYPFPRYVFAGPFGEASHPGPGDTQLLRIGTSNPAGLLRKESFALDLGWGIWAFSETQPSAFTQPVCTRNFKRLARIIGRSPVILHGAPAPVRSEEFNCGRLQATRHVLPNLVVTVGNVYCYPRGPTWPNAKSLNGRLLNVLSSEIVFGCSGPRVILGDLNSDCTDQDAYDVWRRLGWRNLQQFAHEVWGLEHPTYLQTHGC